MKNLFYETIHNNKTSSDKICGKVEFYDTQK